MLTLTTGEVEAHLDEALEPARHETHLARAEPEDEEQRDDGDDAHERDAVDLERSAAEEQRPREEFLDRRTVEATIVGGHRNQQVQSVS